MIRFTNITFQVGKQQILKGVTGSIKSRNITAVLGPNGTGKSTLLKIVAGLFKDHGGTLLLNNQPISSYSTAQLAAKRAVLSQSDQVSFPFSVQQIVELGQSHYARQVGKKKCQSIATELLNEMGIARFAHRSITTLSGGERQKVHLARVLAQLWRPNQEEPTYLLLDEPTTYLDIHQQIQLLDKLTILKQQNIGIFIILHDINLAAQYANYVLLLKDGRTKAFGLKEDIIDEHLLRETFNVPLKVDNSGHVAPHPLVIPQP